MQERLKTIAEKVKTDNLARYYFIALVLHVIQFILYFIPSIKASVVSQTWYSSGETEYNAYAKSFAFTDYFEGAFFLLLVFIILMLVSIFFLGKPLVTDNLYVRNRLVTTKIVGVLNFIFYCFLHSGAKSNMEKYADYGAFCKLNFAGVLFYIFSIAVVVVAFVISFTTKKYPKAKELKSENNQNIIE